MLVQTSSGMGNMGKDKGQGKGDMDKGSVKGKGEMDTGHGAGDICSVRTRSFFFHLLVTWEVAFLDSFGKTDLTFSSFQFGVSE